MFRGFAPRTQLFGATAAVLHYNTVSRVLAATAARWLKIPRIGYFGDFGEISAESTVQGALKAFTALNDILFFDLKATKSEWGARIEFLGVAVTIIIVDAECEAQLSISSDRVERIVNGISGILARKGVLLARAQKQVGRQLWEKLEGYHGLPCTTPS